MGFQLVQIDTYMDIKLSEFAPLLNNRKMLILESQVVSVAGLNFGSVSGFTEW